MEILISPDFETLSFRAAEFFVEISNIYISSRRKFVAAVSGGTTPGRLFSLLGSRFSRKADWQNVHIFMVDERFVPPSHKDSNYRLLHENLLSKISIPAENVHPVKTDRPSPEISARIYEEEMKKFFELSGESLPEFDLILLGIGEDGHTASLFPGSNVLKEKARLAVPVTDEKIGHYRITVTLPVLNNAGNIIFLVSGKNKAEAAKKVLEDREPSLPASMVKPKKGKLFYLLDKEASSYLSNKILKEEGYDSISESK